MEVLRLLVAGRRNREIATTLDITEGTVKLHVSSILGKLGAADRTEAVTRALQRGIVQLRNVEPSWAGYAFRHIRLPPISLLTKPVSQPTLPALRR